MKKKCASKWATERANHSKKRHGAKKSKLAAKWKETINNVKKNETNKKRSKSKKASQQQAKNNNETRSIRSSKSKPRRRKEIKEENTERIEKSAVRNIVFFIAKSKMSFELRKFTHHDLSITCMFERSIEILVVCTRQRRAPSNRDNRRKKKTNYNPQ